MAEPVLIARRPSGVVVVRLNRPERLNALSAELMDRLHAVWRGLAGEVGLRAVVLTGEGRGFCAGADAGFLAAERAPRGRDLDDELNFVPGRVLEVPVILAVNGACAGAGLHFVADADIVLAAPAATFVDPHVSVGQVSGVEPSSLALRLPLPVIARMVLVGAGERLSAQRAYDLGLVTELVDPDRLVERAVEVAEMIAAASPESVRRSRRALRRVAEALEPLMQAGWADVPAHWGHPDAVEGPRAFAEKRPPVWRDPAASLDGDSRLS
jgi:enoyl-CoA hydratase/carnithine racemase